MKKKLLFKKRLLQLVKLSLVQCCIAMIFVGVLLAKDTFVNDVLNKKISIHIEKQDFERALLDIEKQVEVRFTYRPRLFANAQKNTIHVNNEPLSEVLDKIFKPSNIRYKVLDNQVILSKLVVQNKTEDIIVQTSTFQLGEIQNAALQITGTVSDENGDKLPGVNIAVKGSTVGTSTNSKGEYSISVPNEKAILIFSFIGLTTQEITVANKNNISLTMIAENKSLEEVVVIGYGVQKKVNLTGAVSTIDAKSIENRPSSSLATSLQGLSPGLTVQRTSGQPGSEGVSIQIRGATTANGNVDPLVIVDGVSAPSNTLQTINPNDVESISILKDAAAAAIYGAQAAGGVILITTKKGQSGKVKFNYLSQVSTDWAINVPGRMSLLDEANYSNLARKNSGSGPEYSAFDLQQIQDNVPYVVNPADTTNYLYYNQAPLTDQLLKKTAMMHTHNLNASGGTEKFNFLVSGGYYYKHGLFKVGPDDDTRYNFRMNLGSQLTKHLSLNSRIGYTNEKIAAAAGSTSGEGLLYQVYRLRTRTPFFTPEGRYNGAGSGATAYATLESGGYDNLVKNNLDAVFTLKATDVAVKGLNLTAVYGIQNRRGDRDRFNRTVPLWTRTKIASYLNQVNSYTLTKEQVTNTNLQFLVNYSFNINKKHNFAFFAGYQWEDYRFDQVITSANNLVSNDLPTLNLGNDLTKSNSQDIRTYAYQSIFGRFNYNYQGKYLLEATMRSDESSKLAPGLRLKYFPSVSVGWNMNEESFMKGINAISQLKLRASYGTLGGSLGSNLGYYDYLSTLTRGSNLVLGDTRTSYLYQGSIPSSSLSWETIETSNLGLNLGLFKNKIQITADYYVKYNRNMLTPLQLPATIGVGTPKINNGELKSWGWEAEFLYRNKIGKDFNYSVGFNLSDNQNTLLSYAGRRVLNLGTNSIIEGYPLNSVFGYQTAGYFQTADEVKSAAFQDSRAGAGDVKYVDRNGDGKLSVGKGTLDNPGDLVSLGTTSPRYLFGATFGFNWKGIDFSAFFQGVGQRNYMPTAQSIAPLLVTWKQALAIHNDYWTPDNPNALYPRPYTGGTHNYLTSDKWVLDASYVRLKNLQVGYTLPKKWMSKLNVDRARVFFSGQDLFTISGLGKFQGYYDPESRDNVEADYPFFGSASVGLNLSF